jgi:hypothetical protein
LANSCCVPAAAELSRYDWTGVMDVTDDFVAFTIDPEFTDIEAGARRECAARTDRRVAGAWLALTSMGAPKPPDR